MTKPVPGRTGSGGTDAKSRRHRDHSPPPTCPQDPDQKGARAVLSFSRDLEFATETELAKRMGCERSYWLRATLKELIDNALDACEEAGLTVPAITVTIDGNTLYIQDNGPGMAPVLVERLCIRSERTSTREAYAAPDRGAQGNALQVLMALPFGFGLDEAGLTISSQGVEHTIRLRVNRLEQRVDLERTTRDVVLGSGTTAGIEWPEAIDLAEVEQLVAEHAWLNPHALFWLETDEDRTAVWQITASAGKRLDELRLRLWFLLDKPMLGRQLELWCKPGIDAGWLDPVTLRNEVIPHFIAVEIIGKGPDPCPQRWGLIRGERDLVPVPDSALADPPDRRGDGFDPDIAGNLDALRAKLGDRFEACRANAVTKIKEEIATVSEAGHGARHPTYLRAAARIQALCEFWAIPIDRPRQILEEAYLSTLTADEAGRRERGSTRGVWSWLGRRMPG